MADPAMGGPLAPHWPKLGADRSCAKQSASDRELSIKSLTFGPLSYENWQKAYSFTPDPIPEALRLDPAAEGSPSQTQL